MGRRTAVGAAVVLAMLLAAPSANATFHLMSIRAVHADLGNTGADNHDYIELQMYAAGQNHLGGHAVAVYGANGSEIGHATFDPLNNPSNSQSQRSVLIAQNSDPTNGIPGADYEDTTIQVPQNGAACFLDDLSQVPATTVDCVAWGTVNFAPGTVPANTGTPALSPNGFTADGTLVRSIARGCSTMLEAGDDTNNSAADFALGNRPPTDNGDTPVESPCNLHVALGGAGTGGVTGTGINCGVDCDETVTDGQNVVLTANPAPGSVFAGWSGCDTPANNTCTMSMTASKTVTANFDINANPQVTLTVAVGGTGSGTITGTGISCPGDCTETVNSGATVNLTASPAAGSTFAGWSGCDTPANNTCAMSMTQDKAVTGAFDLLPVTLPPIVTQTPPAIVPPPAAATPTGQRAAALKKCAKIKDKPKKKKCKSKARQLPV
jgi:hypothetical protein